MANEKKDSVIPEIFREVVSYEKIQLKPGDEILWLQRKAISGHRNSWKNGTERFYFTREGKEFFTEIIVKSEEEFRRLMKMLAEARDLDFKISKAKDFVNTQRCVFKRKCLFRRRKKS